MTIWRKTTIDDSAVEKSYISHLLPFLFFLMVSGLTVFPIWHFSGWPQNHNATLCFLHLLVYIQHMSQGDFFPLWSSLDNFMYGSAEPLLYHKLFYLVATPLYFLTHSLKTAFLFSIVFFLFVGASGIYRLSLIMGIRYWVAIFAGGMLICANYTITNWLIRGAVAEFSAAMLVPWILLGFLESIQKNKITWVLSISLALVCLAHSVIVYFLIIIFIPIVLYFFFTKKINLHYFFSWPSLAAFALFLCLAGPYLFAMGWMGQDYDMSRITPKFWLPENNFHYLHDYLHDKSWHWGQTWKSYTLQMDFSITLLILINILRSAWIYWIQRKNIVIIFSKNTRCMIFVLCVAIFLQTPLATFFYQYFPGASYIQFPWRLLSIITPIAIVLALFWTQENFSSRPAFFLSITAFLLMVFSCGSFKAIQYEAIQIENLHLVDSQLSSGFGEYIPKAVKNLKPIPPKNLKAQMKKDGCFSQETAEISAESLVKHFEVVCSHPAGVVLPLYSSREHLLLISDALRFCEKRADYPGFCAVFLPQGKSEITVYFPRFSTLLKTLFL